MTVLAAVALAALGLGIVLGDLRFLRVAQREHYLAGSALRFARRWWASRALNTAFLVLCAAGIAISFVSPAGGLLTAAGTIAGPLGLSLRGRTSRLVWTRRLFTTALCTLTAESGLVLAGAAVSGLAGAVAAGGFVAVLVPAVLDGVLLAASPLEGAVSRRFLVRASGRLARFAPLVVAVTGSYGKTTTKGYIAHLASAKLTVLASPYSYNNRLGLARTVNEHLGPATEVLVLEMGTYKRGEIAEMCTWFPPKIAVITAIGP
ncbi:MAG: Mur ligase family protein, partial [Acidimicrobiales bacterium]